MTAHTGGEPPERQAATGIGVAANDDSGSFQDAKGSGPASGHGVRIAAFAEAMDVARDSLWGTIRATPLRPYPFSMRVADVDLGDIVLRIGRSTPLIALGTLPAGAASILMPLRTNCDLLLSGRTAELHGVAVHGAGAEYEIAAHGDAAWALAHLPAAPASGLLSRLRASALLRPRAVAQLRADPDACRRAVALLVEAGEVAERSPEVFGVEEAQRSLRASVLEALYELVSGLGGAAAPPRLQPGPAALRRVVHAADAVLADQPARATCIADVAAAIGVGEARLRAAFLAVLGIGAERYLEARRLVIVRSALRAAGWRLSAVEHVAAAHGFRDFARFERAYRAMFGEAPGSA
jgi:AraC-like DNA-binding protein